MPTEGAQLSRAYAAPLPDDVSVTFAYWNEQWEPWAAVPTVVAPDRRSASAVVHHFSTWTDIVGGSEQAIASIRDGAAKAGQDALEWGRGALEGGAEAIHWSLGNLASTRVELPECVGATPRWVDELSAGTNVNDPVKFCVGSDPANPDLLVVKARSNRGYGFPVVLNVEPAWEYNSTAENSLADNVRRLGNLGSTVGEAVSTLYNEGRFVGPGEEISLGIPATALSDFDSEYLIELPAPSVAQYITSTLAKALVDFGVSRIDGLLIASTAVAGCWSGVNEASNIGAGGGAILGCLSSADEQIAQLMGEAFRLSGIQENAAGKLAGKFIGRISIIVSVLPSVLAALDFAAEQNLPRNARALTISTIDEFVPAPISAGALPPGLAGHGNCRCCRGTGPRGTRRSLSCGLPSRCSRPTTPPMSGWGVREKAIRRRLICRHPSSIRPTFPSRFRPTHRLDSQSISPSRR